MYQPGKVTMPFWAESKNYNPGRDHLGIQNSSVATYTKLLPGLTNVTQRLRYYGFYCWVLFVFKKEENLINLIRRSELLLAFVMKGNSDLEGVNAVSGSNYAKKILNQKNDVINLAKGADKETKGYWEYSMGAFGQYFLGSLENLELIKSERNTHSFIIKERGERLSKAFDKNILKPEKELFKNIVIQGKLETSNLAKLKSFALNANFVETEEGIFYQEMLSNEDLDSDKNGTPLSFRKQSLVAILTHLEQGNDWNSFLYNIYYAKGFLQATNYSKATFGWYYYELNEFVHFSLETIFWAILFDLDNGRTYPFSVFVEKFKNKFFEDNDINVNSKISDLLLSKEDFRKDESQLIEQINQQIKEQDNMGAVFAAFKLILLCYVNNEDQIEPLREYAHLNNMWRDGSAPDFFINFLRPNISSTVSEFIERLLYWIITQHIATAYGKMGRGEKNVLKLVVEDGLLLGINLVGPSFTSPRFGSLYNYLIDLRMINAESGTLTTLGRKYLKSIANDL